MQGYNLKGFSGCNKVLRKNRKIRTSSSRAARAGEELERNKKETQEREEKAEAPELPLRRTKERAHTRHSQMGDREHGCPGPEMTTVGRAAEAGASASTTPCRLSSRWCDRSCGQQLNS